MSFIATDGNGTNFERTFSSRPDVYAGWQQLIGAVQAGLDERRYRLITIAAARELRSSYCMLAHGRALAEQFMSAGTVADLVADHHDAGLDAVDIAIMDFAAKVVRDATAITQADVDGLRAHGLSDRDVLDVVLAASVRCFFSKALDATGTLPDADFADLEPRLRDALVVGRPISPPREPAAG